MSKIISLLLVFPLTLTPSFKASRPIPCPDQREKMFPTCLVARVEVRSACGGTGKTAWDVEGFVAFTSIPLCFAGERELPVRSMEGPQYVFPSEPHFHPGLVIFCSMDRRRTASTRH